MPEYIAVMNESDYEIAVSLFKEYANWLNIDLGFQKFDEELLLLKSMYAAPYGGIILAKMGTVFIGCVAIRKINETTAELKRMYVKPVGQHQGIGSGLLHEAIALAIKCGYKKIQLDTLRNMIPAINLYKKNGFYEIPAYYYNPQETAVYFEKIL